METTTKAFTKTMTLQEDQVEEFTAQAIAIKAFLRMKILNLKRR